MTEQAVRLFFADRLVYNWLNTKQFLMAMGLYILDSVNGKFSFGEKNALVVCAGTVTFKTVSGMGSGFNLFKDLFDYSSNPAWVEQLFGYIEKNHGKTTKLEHPYFTLVNSDDSLSGGVATVPVYQSIIKDSQKKDYKIAIKNAIEEAIKLKKTLYIQPLGIGAYKWPPKLAAELAFNAYQKVVEGCSEQAIPEVHFLIYDKMGNDLLFKTELLTRISQHNIQSETFDINQGKLTSNSFILKETFSKQDKDKQLSDSLSKLNSALEDNNQGEIVAEFKTLSKIACKKRNWFSSLFFSAYSTSTHSATILSEKFAQNKRLLQALKIDNKSDSKQVIKQLQEKMLEACEDKVFTNSNNINCNNN